MDSRVQNPVLPDDLSPYQIFQRDEWARLRADTPMTLSDDDIGQIRSKHDPISINEVEDIYLPLSRLLSMYVAATQELHSATQKFLGTSQNKVPYIIGIAGSVAVGKSTTARVLRALLTRWPNTPKVNLVTTDGFLYPNDVLMTENLMDRKGFPESYDTQALLQFLANIKAGYRNVSAPLYSHLTYDVLTGEFVEIDNPDILIVEGLNVLQPGRPGSELPVVSDYFDFSIYLDAMTDVLARWYADRFMRLRDTAFRDPRSYFKKYASLEDAKAREVAADIWTRINQKNLFENILPTRARASLILTKGQDHHVSSVALRKL
jgi:type I pantothenate kinase